MILVVNMIPRALSGETNQDSEPNIAVNPANPLHIAGSAFTPDPAGGPNAPIFVSSDGGNTWLLNSIVPSQAGSLTGTGDITVRFSATSNILYAGILRQPGFLRLNILRTANFLGAATMTVLVDRNQVDQPYVQATTMGGHDRVYVGLNDFAAGPQTATIDESFDAEAPLPPGPTFTSARIESRGTSGQDGPPIRVAIHPDGTIYGIFYGWRAFNGTAATTDVVVVRDDNAGIGATPFTALVDADGLAGMRVIQNRTVPFLNFSQPTFGQERFVGSNISIAVDPNNSATVYIAWADQEGGQYTLHVRRSVDRGATWTPNDLHTIANATNPALAVNDQGMVGFLFQEVVRAGADQRWVTHIELTEDGFASVQDFVLANVPAMTPPPIFIPYIGDYVHLMAIGSDFHGIFSANNTPDLANFPNGVNYQRNADFTTRTLLDNNNQPVAVSIDPFYVRFTPPSARRLVLMIADQGSFGNVCTGHFVDMPLTLSNAGTRTLTVEAISSSSADFLVPSVLSYPITIEAGNALQVPIRFQPNQFGPAASTITVHSDDPTGPKTVVVSGTAPAPRLTLVVPDDGDFGEVRLGRFTDRDLVINNRGPCQLSVTGIVSSAPIFGTPQVVSFPLTVDSGDSITVPIRFQPTHRGSATATLTIVSNDPNSPAVVNVSGTAWPPLPVAGSALEGYPLSNDSQHVFFIGTDQYVHELDITAGAGWDDNDLTTLAGAVPPTPTSALAGFRLSDDSKHVFFIGTDDHAYELHFTAGEGWVPNDLTALAGAVPPTPTSALDGFRLSDDSKHVFFIGLDNHVHELFITAGGRWDDNDLTTLAGAVPPAPSSDLTGFRLSDDSQHVFFIGTDNHVHELFIAGAGWNDNDLTTLAGAVPPTPTSALTGFRLSDNSEHVFFIGTDNHVHELFIAGAGWNDNDLTTLAGAVPPTPTSALTGYPLSDNSQHVFFIGTDNHVHELFIAGAGWNDNDLTTLAGAVPPTPTSALTGYRLSDNSKHVFFIGTDDHVHELFLTAGEGWLDNDLTALT